MAYTWGWSSPLTKLGKTHPPSNTPQTLRPLRTCMSSSCSRFLQYHHQPGPQHQSHFLAQESLSLPVSPSLLRRAWRAEVPRVFLGKVWMFEGVLVLQTHLKLEIHRWMLSSEILHVSKLWISFIIVVRISDKWLCHGKSVRFSQWNSYVWMLWRFQHYQHHALVFVGFTFSNIVIAMDYLVIWVCKIISDIFLVTCYAFTRFFSAPYRKSGPLSRHIQWPSVR